MCRIAAYLGDEITLQDFLLHPPHSLYRQSYAPRELAEATVNADGFGVGWYDASGTPVTYVNTLPIWADPNLEGLGRCLGSHCWLGNVRSATPGITVNLANTQPFRHEGWLFTHNGFVDRFARTLRPLLQRTLSEQILADVQGTSDSEYLFALIRAVSAEAPLAPPSSWLRETCRRLEQWLAADTRALLTLVLTDGERLYALRHALNAEAPSLYYSSDTELYPEGQVIASEPLDDGGFWLPVPPGQMLVLSPDKPPALEAL